MNTYYVTFGVAHPLAKHYVVIRCNNAKEAYNIVRIQFARYGELYTQNEWDAFTKRFGETYDVHYGVKLAAVIENYKYASDYEYED